MTMKKETIDLAEEIYFIIKNNKINSPYAIMKHMTKGVYEHILYQKIQFVLRKMEVKEIVKSELITHNTVAMRKKRIYKINKDIDKDEIKNILQEK